MEGTFFKYGRKASSLPALTLPSAVFGLMSALLYREGRGTEKKRETEALDSPAQSLFKAGNLCFYKEMDEKIKHMNPPQQNKTEYTE